MTETIMMAAPRRWLRPQDVEDEFGIKVQTQNTLRREGRIPYSKRGNFIFYDRVKIDEWLEDAAVI